MYTQARTAATSSVDLASVVSPAISYAIQKCPLYGGIEGLTFKILCGKIKLESFMKKLSGYRKVSFLKKV